MDTIPDREFMDIFKRVSIIVDLKGCQTPEDVKARIEEAKTAMVRAGRAAEKDSTKKKWFGRVKFLNAIKKEGTWSENLAKKRVGFQTRTIDEASEHPNGRIALTLTHGNEMADEIQRKREERKRTELKRR